MSTKQLHVNYKLLLFFLLNSAEYVYIMSQFQHLKVARLNSALYDAVVVHRIGSNGITSLQTELSNMGLNSASSKLNDVRNYTSSGIFPARHYLTWAVFDSCTMEQLDLAEPLFR